MRQSHREAPAATRAHHFGGEGVSRDSPCLSRVSSDSTWPVSVSYLPKAEVHDRPLSGGPME